MRNVSKILSRLTLLLVLTFALLKVGWSETVITIGTGTNTTGYPYATYWQDGRTQMLYTAAEITAAGGVTGPFSKFALNVSSAASQVMNGFNIRMQNTTLTAIPSTFVTTGWSTVYSGSYAVPGTGWQTIVLQTPFNWDGTSNLLIEVCFDNTSYTSYSYVYATAISNRERYRYTDGAAGCALTSPNLASYRANLRLTQPDKGTLSGTVTNNYNGTPLAGALVTCGSLSATTLANGTYTMQPFEGSYTVGCTATNFVAQTKPATIVANNTTTLNFQMNPIPAYLTGVVTNYSTGLPVVGAKVMYGANYGYSTAGGAYTVNVYPVPTPGINATASKVGFDNYTSTATIQLTQNVTTIHNIQLLETLNPPGPFTATLNGGGTAVDLSWGVPTGTYELIYDDGIQENFQIWSTAGNMNAVKFTGLQYPLTVMGGNIHVGIRDNYATATTLPLTAFQMAIYDATGTNGQPGALIGGPVDVTASAYGWVNFTFSAPVVITTGNFYLVQIQGGVPPQAAGIAIDETSPQMRSYTRFVAGSGPWIPASGNFMMRAIVQGQGGPVLLDGPGITPITGMPNPDATYANAPATVTAVEGATKWALVDWPAFCASASNTMAPSIINYGFGSKEAAELDNSDAAPVPYQGGRLELDNTDVVLYNNGPLVNSPGTGAGGADESVLQAPTLNSLGANANNAIPYRMADDFTVTGTPWSVTSMDFYGYQTGSTLTSTFTGIYVAIWSGKPGVAGSTVIWGDYTTNRMSATSFANIYRRSSTAPGNTTRPVMKVTANTSGLTLNPGSYWVEWGFTGSLASGPWQPAISINGVYATGNALQYQGSAIGYVDWIDLTYPQGCPFIINGTQQAPPGGNLNYQVWRLHQGEELTPGVWTGVAGPITVTSTVDNSWPTLPDGAYRWAVKAQYPGNRWSEPTFSNVLGKNWISDVTVTVDLSCEAISPEGTLVTLTNLAYPTLYTYTATCPATGVVNFPAVWKGTYKLDVTKFAYTPYTLNPVTIMTTPLSFTVMLLEEKAKPRHLFVNDRSLLATWDKPRFEKELFRESFTTGGYTTNQWTTSDAHWGISTGVGNPAPSSSWIYSPQLTNYNSYLTSKNIPTQNAGTVLAQYDIFLDNYGNSTLEQMAIEVWNGTSWIAKRTWDNSSGANIPWTTDVVDISTEVGTQTSAKIRFHAFGEDSFNIDYWYLDNIVILGASANAEECVLGYNFYLNNTLIAYTPDTSYLIPPSQVHYGWLYEATVKAIYGSGYSDTARFVFTAHFLYPPINLAGVGIEDVAYLTWEKPIAYDGPALDQTRPAATGTGPASETGVGNSQGLDMSYITSNATDALFDNGPFVNSPGTGAGGADESVLQTGLTLYGSNMNQALGYSMADDFVVPAGGGWDPTKFIFFGYQTNSPSSGTFTGAFFRIYNGPPNAGGTVVWGDLTTNRMTLQAFSNCYRVQNVAGGTARAIIRIECNISGLHLAPGTYWVEVQTTGSGASGPWANPITINGTLATGNGLQWTGSAWNQWLDGSYQQGLPFIIEGPGGGGTPPGLVGYNIYRDGPFLYFVDDPDVLEYYDLGLDPGTYIYNITAKYDLTPYGFPGLFDESLEEGPDTVVIMYGRELPFFEPWDQGQFAYNEWRFEPTQSNWNMNTGFGNPAPSADFNWQPMITNYESNLETPVLNAGKYACGKVYLDFDWKLNNRNATGDEKLWVGIYVNGSWKKIDEFVNDNSYDWTMAHYEITSDAKGKAFRIGFKANGANSADILHWYVDNIHVYGVCLPAENLDFDKVSNNVTLTWSPPQCGPSGTLVDFIYDDGTWEDGLRYNPGYVGWCGTKFPILPTMSGVMKSVDVYYVDNGSGAPFDMTVDIFDVATEALLGSSAPFSASAPEIWINVTLPDVPFTGPVYAMVKWDNLSGSSYYLGADTDGPHAAEMLAYQYDGTTFSNPTYWPSGAVFMVRGHALVYSDLDATPVTLDPTYKGFAYFANQPGSSNIGGGASKRCAFDPWAVSNNNHNNLDVLTISYDVYRMSDSDPMWTKINATPVLDTTYLDANLPSDLYWYYVSSVFSNGCVGDSSNNIFVDIRVGIDPLKDGAITIYPNPATEMVNVKSDYIINTIEVMSFIGQAVYTDKNVASRSTKINVSNLQAGVYFVKVTTPQGTRTVKITVTR